MNKKVFPIVLCWFLSLLLLSKITKEIGPKP